ncbi:MAG: disulfide bond formation protein B [marine bacterium B5-7]|nr:MAG: disulfide bond formation protein B [marine bacterium B5-7]
MQSIGHALSRNNLFWWIVLAACLTLECIALYYQYVLDYLPCVLCIHVRMWLALLIVVSLIMLFAYRNIVMQRLALIISTLIGAALIERSWQLLSTERGWSFGDCSMQSGLPSWLPIEQWLPWLFKIHEPCGYTPEVPFGLTMAEVLLVITTVYFLVALTVTVLSFRQSRFKTAT